LIDVRARFAAARSWQLNSVLELNFAPSEESMQIFMKRAV